jgi:hypothetical protein
LLLTGIARLGRQALRLPNPRNHRGEEQLFLLVYACIGFSSPPNGHDAQVFRLAGLGNALRAVADALEDDDILLRAKRFLLEGPRDRAMASSSSPSDASRPENEATLAPFLPLGDSKSRQFTDAGRNNCLFL